MSKYSWMPLGVDELINKAVYFRIQRWSIPLAAEVPGEDAEQRAHRIKTQRMLESARRVWKYKSSAALRAALWNAEQWIGKIEPKPEWWKLRKRIMKEISRRYAVVDRACGGTITRKNGSVVAIYK